MLRAKFSYICCIFLHDASTSSYSKNLHKRTSVLGVQADFVVIHRVFSAKSD